MKLFHYVKIKNFKSFGAEIKVNLDQPSVLIGPNNTGKTSVLQALALWSFGVKSWYQAKGDTKATKNLSSGINRLNLTQLPVQNARFLWNNTEVRKGSNELIPLEIAIGLEFKGNLYECTISFTQQSSEIIYCLPNREFYENRELLEFASKIQVNLLYSMSGVAREEVLIPEGRIDSLIGQGQTSEVLRNLCYKIYDTNKADWEEIVDLMKKLFHIKLQPPKYIAASGTLELKYGTSGVRNDLDIAMAGRGLQQFLLLFSYLFSHKNSVLLLDEPDAHLEILRQKTIFTVLKRLTQKNGNQLIIATHSEVILNDSADTNLELILLGEAIHLADKDEIKNTLKEFGIEHYLKAKQKKSILYVEGSTDIDMLTAFAKLIDNKEALDILDSNLNYYYIQNTEPENTLDNEINRNQGYYGNHFRKHFNAIKSVVPDVKGIGIFDSDGNVKIGEKSDSLAVFYWKRYELENYFIKPSVITRWAQKELGIVGTIYQGFFDQALDECMIQKVFNNKIEAFEDYKRLPLTLQDNYWLSITGQMKMSAFFDEFIRKYYNKSNHIIDLNKGHFYELIQYLPINEVDEEIKNVLKELVAYLS